MLQNWTLTQIKNVEIISEELVLLGSAHQSTWTKLLLTQQFEARINGLQQRIYILFGLIQKVQNYLKLIKTNVFI